MPPIPCRFFRCAAAALLFAAASGCGWFEPALEVHVTLAPVVKATCVRLSVYPSSDVSGASASSILVQRPAGKDELFLAVYKATLPAQVWVTAQPLFGAECQEPLAVNGAAAVASGSFPPSGVTTVELAIAAPTAAEDADGDGFVGGPSGADCNDGDPAVFPGAPEHCQQPVDFNCDGKIGCADPTCTAGSCLASPTQLVFITSPRTQAAGACSAQPITVETRDATGAPVPVVAPTVVTFSAPDANLGVFSDGACATALTGVTLQVGSSRASAYVSGTVAGPARLSASSPGLGTVEQTETIQPGPTSAVVFTSAAQTQAPLNGCSAPVTVQLRDSFGNPTPVGAARNLGLASDANPSTTFKFYPDAACAATSITQTPVAAGASTSTFYFKSTASSAGTVTITVTDGARTATQAEGLVFRAPTQLAFITPQRSAQVNACSAVVTLQTQDSAGSPAPVTAATTFPLSATGGGMTFYSDAACTTAITQATIAASLSSGNFYFKGATAGTTPTITANGGSFGSPTQQETITAPLPTQLAFATTAQTSVVAGACSGTVDLESRDASNVAAAVTAATTINLATTPAGQLLLYAGANCQGAAVNSVTLSAGTSRVSLSFSGTLAGSTDLTISATGLTSATQTEGVVAAAAAKVRIIGGRGQTVDAGACSAPITIELEDQYDNPVVAGSKTTVNLAPTSGMTYYGSCGGGTTGTAQINAGAMQGSFSFSSNTPQTLTITETPQNGALTGDSALETIQAGAPTQLKFTSAAQGAVPAGSCSADVVLTTYDAANNVSPVRAATAVTLTGPAGMAFYAGSGCGGGAVTSVTIPNGASTVTYSFLDQTSGSGTLTATASGLGAPTQAVTVVALAASQLVFTAGPFTLAANACSGTAGPLTIQSQDQYGNPAPVALNTDVALSGANAATAYGITFYTGSSCSGTTPTIRIAGGNSTSANLYFKTSGAGSWLLTGAFGTLTSATQTETVTPLAPNKLAFTSSPQTVPQGNCSARVTIQVQDSLGNPSPPTGTTNVSLTPTADPFYVRSNCTGSIGGNVLVLPANTADGQYYFQAPGSAGNYVIGISGVGSPVSQTETIQ